ncbi:GFA family protein [Primorskyibacter sp. S187A]|uniref:GFA family protein n=1 Tax=Primorskyibacter sp. S187A TaxID=3415130 RepID=UPI003C7A007A
MSAQDSLQGRCMCGAVTAVARPTKDFITACNCENCRRWGGGTYFAFHVDAASAEITGPVKTVSVAPWAERGFCSACGSNVSYRIVAEGPHHGVLKLSAGLFPEGTGLPLGVEYFTDERPTAFDLSRPHEEMTAEAVRALLSGEP